VRFAATPRDLACPTSLFRQVQPKRTRLLAEVQRCIYCVMRFAGGIALILLVEMIPYNESKHSIGHALEIL
jgi:hypothetical protein